MALALARRPSSGTGTGPRLRVRVCHDRRRGPSSIQRPWRRQGASALARRCPSPLPPRRRHVATQPYTVVSYGWHRGQNRPGGGGRRQQSSSASPPPPSVQCLQRVPSLERVTSRETAHNFSMTDTQRCAATHVPTAGRLTIPARGAVSRVQRRAAPAVLLRLPATTVRQTSVRSPPPALCRHRAAAGPLFPLAPLQHTHLN